ncbi:MAG: DUF4870 domain-containing protein [Acidobacteriaceae bacterium]|nr:DUF4870 domain-containing protein [Acidobacteriaceae bacterium]
MPAQAAFCPKCGRRMIIPASAASNGSANERLFAALSYFTFVPAVVFLNLRRFKHEPLVRFHSLQSISFSVALLASGLILRAVFWLCALVPRYGYLLGSLAAMLIGLGAVILWLLLIVKALQGELFKVPVIGHFAEK